MIPLFWKLASEPHIPGLIPSSSSLSAEFMRAGEHDFASARHLCEVLTRSDVGALTEILEPLGYSFYLLMDDGPQPRHTVAPDPRWLNYYFTTRRPG